MSTTQTNAAEAKHAESSVGSRVLGPVLLYDGACPLCSSFVRPLRWLAGERVSARPVQDAMPEEAAPEEFRFVDGGGEVHSGAAAVREALATRPVFRPAAAVLRMPGIRNAADTAYKFVSKRRHALTRRVCGHSDCDR